MVEDAEGRWWAKHRETGEWHYYDGSTWVREAPPGYQEGGPAPSRASPTAARPVAAEEGRRPAPWLLLAAGLAGVVVLVALAAYLWAGRDGATSKIEVPNVVGRSQEEAARVLRSEGFRAKTETRENSEENAGKVIEQSPSGGEAQENSEVVITVGEGFPPETTSRSPEEPKPAPGYALVRDPSGSLSVEVPSDWSDRLTGASSEEGTTSWSSVVGWPIASSITATPSLDDWESPDAWATGAYVVASRQLAQSDDDDLLEYGLNLQFSDDCVRGSRQNLARPSYSGRIQTWNNCDGTDTTVFTAAAAPEGRECVVLLQIHAADQADT